MILVALGANLPSEEYGSPAATLTAAVRAMEERGLRVRARSRWFETEPVPRSDQPWFVNGVVAVETSLAPDAVMALLHEIEAAFGRVRRVRWAARVLDLDLVAYDDLVLPSPEGWAAAGENPPQTLVLPHPRMHERPFVLAPLVDIAADWRHPVLGRTARDLLASVPAGGAGDGIIRPLPDRHA